MIKDKNSQHHLQRERIKSNNFPTNKKPHECGAMKENETIENLKNVKFYSN